MVNNVGNNDDIGGVNLYIRPTYIVAMPNFPRGGKRMTLLQRENLKNLERNKSGGKISKKARQRLNNSVNWLVSSAKKKWVWNKEKKKYFSFRLNFITLTLPGDVQEITDNNFKKVLLHNFINQCRYHYGLKNYIWKVEAQENGKIHAHFTTDTFMHWKGVRRIWNQILDKNGLLDLYRNKHRKMSKDEYIKTYSREKGVSTKDLIRRYKIGVAEGWSNPNTTDIHAVYKVRDIGAYLAKYMSKEEEDRRKITGRLWSCNYNLALARKLYVNLPSEMNAEIYTILESMKIKKADIWTEGADREKDVPIGKIFFIKLNDMLKNYKNELTKLYREILFNLRYNISITELVIGAKIKVEKPEIKQEDEPVEYVRPFKPYQLQMAI